MYGVISPCLLAMGSASSRDPTKIVIRKPAARISGARAGGFGGPGALTSIFSGFASGTRRTRSQGRCTGLMVGPPLGIGLVCMPSVLRERSSTPLALGGLSPPLAGPSGMSPPVPHLRGGEAGNEGIAFEVQGHLQIIFFCQPLHKAEKPAPISFSGTNDT